MLDAIAAAMESRVLEQPGSPGAGAMTPWVEVLVDCPGAQGAYTYEVPFEGAVRAGDMLLVPFGGQTVGAIALHCGVALPEGLDPAQVKPIQEVTGSGFFAPEYWQMLERVADYYCTPLIQVVRAALPPGLLGRSQRRLRRVPGREAAPLSPAAQEIWQLLGQSKSGSYTWRFVQQQFPGAKRAVAKVGLRELIQAGWVESFWELPAGSQPKRQQVATLVHEPDEEERQTAQMTDKQGQAIAILARHGGELWVSELTERAAVSTSVLKTLERKGYVCLHTRELLRQEEGPLLEPDSPKPLTPDQAKALAAIQDCEGFQTILLHGVTGSGKTEVYLQAIAPVLQRGQSALVLVPEIGLTPQLTDRFRQRFGRRVCVYHSGLSEGERYDTWRQLLPLSQSGHATRQNSATPTSVPPPSSEFRVPSSEFQVPSSAAPLVVIGTRSAIFAPLGNLGLIILDEEHDSSFKQDQPMPCYHARTVALWRGEQLGCPVVLGSATPALETWYRSPTPLYLGLPERIQARPMPPIEVVDMREQLLGGNRSIFSGPLCQALRELKAKGQQGILFIQRRGHSSFVSCRSCGEAIACPHCDVSLSLHQPHPEAPALLRCHYCNFSRPSPTACPSCASPYLKPFGSGTQRVTQALSQELPELRWIRFDSDTTRHKGAHRQLLEKFAAGEADILVGTQMLTKGIDLPQVTLVGILAADGLLHLSDFRAGERAAQTLLQVAGRAGRGEEPGRVILQTYTPEHPVVGAVQRQDYVGFLRSEYASRSPLHYPPAGQLVLLRLSGLEEAAVERTAERLAQDLAVVVAALGWEVLGPAPALVPRVAQRFRWNLLLKGPSPMPASSPPEADLRAQLKGLRSRCVQGVSLTIDVDPLNLN